MTTTRPPRFPPLVLEELTGLQRQVAEEFVKFSARKAISGPAMMLLRSPEVAGSFIKLSDYLRSGTKVPLKLAELAVLIHARLWTDQYEWSVHAIRAREAGLPDAVIADLQVGRSPKGLKHDEQAVYDYCVELSKTKAVSDETFARIRDVLNEAEVVDLTIMLGMYGIVSYLLSVGEAGTVPGQTPPLAPMANPFGG